MDKETLLAELKILQNKADNIRKELGISPPQRVTFLADRDATGDELVVVEADGFGGAITAIVEGNYPVDYAIKFSQSFESEEDAERVAEHFAFEGGSPNDIPRTVASSSLDRA